ncbi:Metacaspase-1 [Seminavis robusta]|uniref:Metacaspase-1 n=1 Tax=Seminavis robusta TaxID=568900 RepID=A0A9N8EBB6_9STRA|nr:Metacaspase-1 [Seminavis robusta]|eukprot:Sro759_g198180.1 Metacaspase-1 (636) ;mRNA; f:13359-15686
MEEAQEQAEKYIPADVRLISGCRDEQTSADVSNVADFKLPDPSGKAGGACTSAMLQVLYADHTDTSEDLTFEEVILKIRDNLSENFSQIPQLSSSRNMNVNEKFHIVPDEFEGTKRAVMIGINYVGQDGELSGCHNDVNNMMEYLLEVHGFEHENITLLMDDDDDDHIEPTKENILAAYEKLVEETEEGDVVFCHFSGHGGRLKDDDGDEDDGFDESLVPLDYSTGGQIRDDDLLTNLVRKMPSGVTMTCVFDCCHSGTVLDLPFVFIGDGEHEAMESAEGYNFGGGGGDDDEEFVDDENENNNAAAASPPPKKKSGGFCCFGGKEEESDDEFDGEEGEDGKPPGHRKVIVIGASGMVGRAVLPVLVFRYGEHLQVYAGTRDPSSFEAVKGVNVVKADMADKKSLTKTLKHFDRAMIIVPNNRPDLAANALEAADSAKSINFVLVLSVLTAPLTDTIFGKHFNEIETKAKQVFPASYCILRCPVFIDSLLTYAESIKEDGSFSDPRDPDMPFTPIAVRDVARAASDILAKPNQNAEKTYKLVCAPFSLHDQAAALSSVLEKAITVSTIEYEACRDGYLEQGYPEWQVDGTLEVFKLIDEGNEITNEAESGDFEEITDSKATTIEEWCQINASKFM